MNYEVLEQWERVGEVFEDYFPLFYTFWKLGKPVFVTGKKLPTAAVSFDKSGDFINFIFNEQFWNECTDYDRAFIIGHESLHVLLNHGIRAKDLPREQHVVANIAMDVVVNHMLVNYFGFDRKKITIQKELCWTDTVFGSSSGISSRQNYEYYFNELMKKVIFVKGVAVFSSAGTGDPLGTIDDHNSFFGQDSSEITRKINKEAEKDPNAKEAADDMNEAAAGRSPNGTGGWYNIAVEKVTVKKKWETLFRKLFKMWSEAPSEQWAQMPRRFSNLPSDIILPSEMEDEERKKEKIKIWLFLDVSGSCSQYKRRFVKAYRSIPKDKFEIKLHSFDTRVEEVTPERIYGGGGTSFYAIENYIRWHTKDSKYPQIVVVFTDGDGGPVHPLHPERWYWFLDSRYCNKRWIPAKSKIQYLCDYE